MKILNWHNCYSGSLKGIISDTSFAHPAKFSYNLIRRIYKHGLEQSYWEAGDLIADPFAGCSVGGIVAAANGLRWIGIELEQKFIDLTVGFDCDGIVERHQEEVWIEPRPSGWFVRLRIRAQYWDASGETSFGGPRGDGWATKEEAQTFVDSIADSEEVQGYPLSTLYWEPVEGHYATKWVCDKPAKCGSCEPHDSHHVTGSFELHKEQWEKMGKPHPIILQGDSRNFRSIIREAVNSIITSPPYTKDVEPHRAVPMEEWRGTEKWGGPHSVVRAQGYPRPEGQIGAMKEGKLDEVVAIITSPPFVGSTADTPRPAKLTDEYVAEWGHKQLHGDYGQSKGQLGAMKEGDFEGVINSVITSPPYPEVISTGERRDIQKAIDAEERYLEAHPELKGKRPKLHLYGDSEGQIGHLHEGDHGAVVSGIVTSPPYAKTAISSQGADGESQAWNKAYREYQITGDCQAFQEQMSQKCERAGYSLSPANMGNLPEGSHEAVVDAVVTSPPYERSMDSSENAEARAERADGFTQGMKTLKYGENPYGFLSKDPSGLSNEERHRLAAQNPQIGQKQGATYWGAVKDVYCECLKALKPGGVMAVVVKSFIRKGKIIDLPSQTLELLEAIGFEPLERIRAWMVSPATQASMMPSVVPPYRKEKKSFFRRLAERKGSPRIDFEEVLIFQKPNDNPNHDGLAPQQKTRA